jgi:hypothetical protein
MLHTCVEIVPLAITHKLAFMKAFNISLHYLHVVQQTEDFQAK